MRLQRAGGTSDAGSSAPSSHALASRSAPTPPLSPPTGAPGKITVSGNTDAPPADPPTGAPGQITVSGNTDAPPADLIDLHSPSVMPGENISGMMATMNLHCN
jgi:hypothetical protein